MATKKEIAYNTYIDKKKERLYTALDFYRIIDMLESYFTMEDSIQYFLLHRPKSTAEEVRLIQEKSKEYIVRSHISAFVFDRYLSSITSILFEAKKRTMHIEELQNIAGVVYAINKYIWWLSNTKTGISENKQPLLVMSHSVAMQTLERSLLQYFDKQGNLLYNTIPALKKIQAQRSIYHRKRNDIASSFIQKNNTICMSKTPSLKSERLVIPINTSYKSQVDGIIHAVSASAQTVFVEIKPLYEVNNAIELLDLEEEKVLYEIAKNLTKTIVERSAELSEAYQYSIEFDIIKAQCEFGARYKGVFPYTHIDNTANDDTAQSTQEYDILLKNAIHPLIERCTPITIQCKNTHRQVILTGPNAGGKTIVLKTLGVLALLHQCGIALPVDEYSRLPVFETIDIIIGDRQNVSEGESTFSAHLKEIHNALPVQNNLHTITPTTNSNHLLLFDEMCSGTDEQEGGTLAWGILEYILQHQHYYTFVTTHSTLLKYYAMEHERVEIAAMESNEKKAYDIVYGATGKSEAMLIAKRIAMNPSIIETQKHILHRYGRNTNELMERLHILIVDAKEKQEETQALLQENKIQKHNLLEWERYLKDKELNLKRNHINEGTILLSTLKEHITKTKKREQALLEAIAYYNNTNAFEKYTSGAYEKIFSQGRGANTHIEKVLKETSKHIGQTDTPEKEFSTILKQMSAEVEKDTKEQMKTLAPITEGDEVIVLETGMKGTVIKCLSHQKHMVRVGIITLTLHRKDIKKEEDTYHSKYINETQDKKFIIEQHTYMSGQYNIEHNADATQQMLCIDVRGKSVEESMAIIETHLNNAVVSQIYAFSIIHGKGAGILSRAIRNMLKHHSLVSTFNFAPYDDGGEGKTIVHL